MNTYFIDTSALIKRYHIEEGTPRVLALFADTTSSLFISELALVEAASALRRRRNRGEISDQVMINALDKFEDDTVSRFSIVNVRRDLIERAKSLVLRHNLRTLDALQLATVLSLKDQSPVFVAADDRLLQAAQANGLSVLNPALAS